MLLKEKNENSSWFGELLPKIVMFCIWISNSYPDDFYVKKL